MADDGPIASEQLRLFLERIERLKEEIKGLQSDVKDVFSEAKGQGFDTGTMKDILKLRAMDINVRREREALLDTYKAALGMLDGTPLGTWAVQRLSKPKPEEPAAGNETAPADDVDDPTYEAAVRLVTEQRKASTSWLQRQLRIGYNAAAKLIERMAAAGLVSQPDHVGRREVLAPAPEGAEPAQPAEPEPTVEDARRMGDEAAKAGAPVTANPFPARDVRRAAWDEAWCAALGSDGMDIPDALKPTPKPKKGGGEEPKGEAK